jgi:hypothetical protein
LDEGQAPWREQSPAHALQGPGRDQDLDGGGEAAEQRRARKPDHADDEDPAAAVPVAQRPAEQEEGGQGQQVAVEDPLQAGDVGIEVVGDGR